MDMPGEPRWERSACPLCGPGRTHVLTRSRDLVRPEDGTVFRVVRCAGCDLAYVDPRPVRDDMVRYYPSTYGGHRDIVGSERRVLQRRSKRFDPVAGMAPGRYLDVGCGGGQAVLRMKAKGWDAVGFEVSPKAVASARAAGLDIRGGAELADARLEEGTFDLVTFFCVLPHLHDPLGTLREVARLLKPDGRVLLTVPTLASVNFMLFRDLWYHLDVPRHLYFFSDANLRAMAARTGFVQEGRRFRSGGGGFKNSLRVLSEVRGVARLVYDFTRFRASRWLVRTFYRFVVDRLRLGDTVDCWWTKA